MAKVEWMDIVMVIANIDMKNFFKLLLYTLFTYILSLLGFFNLLCHSLQTLFSSFL